MHYSLHYSLWHMHQLCLSHGFEGDLPSPSCQNGKCPHIYPRSVHWTFFDHKLWVLWVATEETTHGTA